MRIRRVFYRTILPATLLPYVWAQAPVRGVAQAAGKQMQSRSSSTISYSSKGGEETVEIANVAFEIAGESIPGRPSPSWLVLRTTTHSKEILGDKGVDSTVTMEAWPMGADLQRKPLYAVTVPAIGAQTLEGALWVVDRSLDPDVSWWSIYKLASGQHLFDTYVQLLSFSISRETLEQRYAGIEVPPDNTPSARLKDSHVIAVVTYASAEKVIREALVTCDNVERAQILRSYADSSRTLSATSDQPPVRGIRMTFSANYPSAANSAAISIPIAKDDLDLAHSELPAGFRVAAWRR